MQLNHDTLYRIRLQLRRLSELIVDASLKALFALFITGVLFATFIFACPILSLSPLARILWLLSYGVLVALLCRKIE